MPPLAGAGVDVSADRHAFLGARGDVSDPAALRADRLLDGRAGAGGDPCAAFRVELAPAPGETVECAFLLGEAEDEAREGALDRALLDLFLEARVFERTVRPA